MNKKINDFQLSVHVNECELTRINNETTILFYLDFYSEITKIEWKLIKSLFHIKQLYSHLSKKYLSVPSLSFLFKIDKSVHLLSSTSTELSTCRLELEHFLNDVITQSHLINSNLLKAFLELDHHLNEYDQHQPILLNEIRENKEITDIQYSSTNNLIFVGMAYNSSKGTISSYISSFTSLWNSAYLGELSIYHIAKSNYEEIQTNKIFNKQFTSPISKLSYLEGDNLDLLSVGFFDGSIVIYRIYTYKHNYHNNDLVDQMSKLKPHNYSIIDFGIEADFGYMYSAALNEKYIAVSEFNYETVIKKVPVSNYSIACFKYDKESRRIFTCDSSNSIWVLQVENYININIVQGFHNQIFEPRCLIYEPEISSIIIANNGFISLHEIIDQNESSTGNISITKKIDIILDPSKDIKITDIKYNPNKQELMASLSNGIIAAWSHSEEDPEYILDCHDKSVTTLLHDETFNTLVSCSTDKTIKIWHMPEHYPSEVMQKDSRKNDYYFINEHTTPSGHIANLHDALRNIDFDKRDSSKSLEEDLNKLSMRRESIKKRRESKDDYFSEITKDLSHSTDPEQDDLDGWDMDESIGAKKRFNPAESFNQFMGI